MKKNQTILIVEDDLDINEAVATFLKKHGHDCLQAYSGSEALLVLESYAEIPALVVCDLMLPGITGRELIPKIREMGGMPIIMISANDATVTKIELLNLGADDYLGKPFDLHELLARIQVQLRRRATPEAATPVAKTERLCFGTWVLDDKAHTFEASGAPIKLTRIEFSIVRSLMSSPKRVFTKQELYRSAWSEDYLAGDLVDEASISVHVSNIRAKLKSTDTSNYIETVWGIGFKLADVHTP